MIYKYIFRKKIHTPITNLPAIKVPIFGEAYSQKEPAKKRISEISIDIFLPYLSERGPTIKEPIAPPTAAIEIIN